MNPSHPVYNIGVFFLFSDQNVSIRYTLFRDYLMKVVAVILAAGRSTRMGSGENKVLRSCGGRPVLSYSLEAFQRCPAVTHMVVIGRVEDRPILERIVREFASKAVGHIAEGGSERFDSVLCGLKYSRQFEPDAVLIHDSARPFVEERYIIDSLEAIRQDAAGCIIGVPLKDTLKETDRTGLVVRTPERSRFWLSQTPQTFRFQDIFEAYQAYKPPPFPTDDGAVLEWNEGRVKMIEGSYHNIKLTTPEDWTLAEALLRIRRPA